METDSMIASVWHCCTFFRVPITFFGPWQKEKKLKRVCLTHLDIAGINLLIGSSLAASPSSAAPQTGQLPRSTYQIPPIRLARTRKSPADIWWRLDRIRNTIPNLAAIKLILRELQVDV